MYYTPFLQTTSTIGRILNVTIIIFPIFMLKLEKIAQYPMKILSLCISLIISTALLLGSPCPIYAVSDPLSVPNNKHGLHIISATNEEIEPTREMVNTNGDWGYITLLIESKDRNESKWQQVFDELRRKHLIPIVRIATEPEGSYWRRPSEGEEHQWAEFLDKLRWPTKNRYVVIYNEPNHATEWGNSVDAKHYARILDKTIAALKQRSADFFVMNAGFDASAPQKIPAYQDQLSFMRQMNEEVPGIFERLDGWSSHSYPNPAFKGSPTASGRTTIRGYQWEMDILKDFGVNRDLPIFITETGWKRAEGKTYDPSLPDADTVAEYYKHAYENAWNDPQIAAVTPFLLNYQDEPFDNFSFKKPNGSSQQNKIIKDVLGAESEYYPQYEVLKNMPKTSGRPVQENTVQVIQTNFLKSAVLGETYMINLKVKNTGQSIWNEYEQVKLIALDGAESFNFREIALPLDKKVEPNGEYTFTFPIKLNYEGTHKLVLMLEQGGITFNSPPISNEVKVTTPARLTVHTGLKWKNNPSGEYKLTISSFVNNAVVKLIIGENGNSELQELKALVPDYSYDFTLERPNYKPKTVRQKIQMGDNFVDFGELQPDITSAILRPDIILQFVGN